jgi:hypothetical protein
MNIRIRMYEYDAWMYINVLEMDDMRIVLNDSTERSLIMIDELGKAYICTVYMYVCMCVYIYVCICICIYEYIYRYVHTYIVLNDSTEKSLIMIGVLGKGKMYVRIHMVIYEYTNMNVWIWCMNVYECTW